jgi:hypothetical protein
MLVLMETSGSASAALEHAIAQTTNAQREIREVGALFKTGILALFRWMWRKVLSSLFQKNKPEPTPASQVFKNAILCEQRPILSKQEQGRGT